MEIRTYTTQTRGAADAELPLPVPRVPDLSGRILGARYSLRRRIGGGSMGTVYEARDMTRGTAVAIKVMHPEYSHDEAFRKRFHQEALIGARLRHEHSCAVTDLGQSDDGLLFSVMEYLEGESLDALLSSRTTPLPWRRVVLIAAQVCAALQAAHDRGIIHRDIKPGNCFLVRQGGDGQPGTMIKVLDLGLARVMPVGGRPTPPGRLGAPEYLAPEQIQGGICDHRVDLYALGVMMFALLTRSLPFVGATPAAVMRAHLESSPPPLRSVLPDIDIPASIEAIIVRALAKDPAERFTSADAMAQALRAAALETVAEARALEELDDDDELAPRDDDDDDDDDDDRTPAADSTGATWRRLPPPTTMPTMSAVSAMSTLTSMVLAPDPGYASSRRSGFMVLGLAFAGICVAVTLLWSSNRLLSPSAEILDGPAQPAAPAPLATVTPPPPTIHQAPLGPVEPTPDSEALAPGDIPWADPEPPPPTVEPAAAAPALVEPAAATPALTESALVTPKPAAPQPRRQSARPTTPPPGPELPPGTRTPGVPLERTFRRLADSVAPGVHRCMRTHLPDLASLTVELTVGGPRHTAVELVLKDVDSPDLRACLAPLLARIEFPATERTARYAFTYKP